ncbi:thymidine phosphorylase [Williamsia limnetica]|uniref:Thymidine phosphorylase n=1 Tax=Williamsia limnetica TaxID=882452 RepID=A0A318REN2_WILLI|nr:thymidine phosphorylase [Williamsia limnetica]PYE14674.1 thymidine phosphorylase [Williamsia limnetica]
MDDTFDTVSVIATKRDGGALSDAQIDWVIEGFTAGEVHDEQMSALAMAILLRGMDRREISRWTAAMTNSGQRMDFRSLRRGGKPLVTVDKHSTGGVGDKITLPLAPLVASYGIAVPQLSGRGLGHTGGTLDKLEAIPGWRSDLTYDEIVGLLESVGAVVCAAGASLAPADKKLYALRDVTGTVESIPLIASSIMSKKIAEGTQALVLDVKVGSGAFMKSEADARELAQVMVELGNEAGVRTSALLTSMSEPLGMTAGNALEVAESLEVLSGGGPPDVVELTLALATEMLAAAGVTGVDVAENLRNGKAMDVWEAMVRGQGGDPKAALPQAEHSETISAEESGVIESIDAMAVGRAAWRLGAGRARQGETVQAEAGVRLHVRSGDRVQSGDPVFTMYTATPERFGSGRAALAGSTVIGSTPPQTLSRVIDRVTVET